LRLLAREKQYRRRPLPKKYEPFSVVSSRYQIEAEVGSRGQKATSKHQGSRSRFAILAAALNKNEWKKENL
jgi:hypothetical protein